MICYNICYINDTIIIVLYETNAEGSNNMGEGFGYAIEQAAKQRGYKIGCEEHLKVPEKDSAVLFSKLKADKSKK